MLVQSSVIVILFVHMLICRAVRAVMRLESVSFSDLDIVFMCVIKFNQSNPSLFFSVYNIKELQSIAVVQIKEVIRTVIFMFIWHCIASELP